MGLALAVSCSRLFVGAEAVTVLVAVATGSWALATALRRSPLRPATGEVAHAVVGVVVALVAVGRSQTWFGVPTPGSVTALAEAVRDDFAGFSTAIAPVPAGPGHLVVVGALVWALALFASSVVMRLRSPVQGVVPHVLAVIVLGAVARDAGRATAAVVLVAAVGAHAVAQATWRAAAMRWLPSHGLGMRAALGGSALVVGGAAVAALAIGPWMPGGNDPVLDLRGSRGSGGPRNVVSPFVSVGAQLGERSDELLFTGAAPGPGYWRLTALDEFDTATSTWLLQNSYRRADGTLEQESGSPATLGGSRFDARVEVEGLRDIFIPVPDPVIEARGSIPIQWDPRDRSLTTPNASLAGGDTIDFVARQPTATPDRLRAADAIEVPGTAGVGRGEAIDVSYLDTSGITPQLGDIVATLEGPTGYDTALALQDHFREYSYDESVDFSDAPSPIDAFLDARRGFCQQFATAFTLAARRAGLPTRVVVGFTAGDPVGPLDDEGLRSYEVRGRHAHAWPEVYFAGVGWVPFEPTPGRGNPAVEDVTGVAAAQAPPPQDAGGPTSSTAPTTAATGAGGAAPTTLPRGEDVTGAGRAGEDGTGGTPWGAVAAIVAVLAIAAATAVVARQGSRDAPGRDLPADRAGMAWRRALTALGRVGLAPRESETPMEFASRVPPSLAADRVADLASVESARRWSDGSLGPDDVDRAEAAAEQVGHAVDMATAGSSGPGGSGGGASGGGVGR
jgi:transglutaminase-like putative cysteine protease